MKLPGRRRFSVMLTPAGVHAVEYRVGRTGIRILGYREHPLRASGMEDAVDAVAELVEGLGGRGGEVAVSLTGFGSVHHIQSLPAAPREVLAPVVVRELRRFYPNLFAATAEEPVVDFVALHAPGQPADAAQRDLLVAALPRPLVDRLHAVLRSRRIALHHLTIVPRAVACLYELVRTPAETAVSVVLVPRWPLIGFFHAGEISLFSEPLLGEPDSAPNAQELVMEQVERGALFLRQQFRGAAISRVLLAAAPDDAAAVRSALHRRLDAPVEPFGAFGDGPGALAALGAAIDARGPEGRLNLLPTALRPRSDAQRSARGLAVATSLVLAVAGAGWAWSGLRAEREASARYESLAAHVAQASPALQRMEETLRARRSHSQRVAALERLAGDHQTLQEILYQLALGPDAVSIGELRLEREPRGWTGTVRGTVRAGSSSAATEAVDRLYRDLAAGLPGSEVRLAQLGYVEPEAGTPGAGGGDGAIAVVFEIALIVTDTEMDN